MVTDIDRLRSLLDRFELDRVFIGELGWDNPPSGVEPVVVPDDEIAATQIADKRGVGVWRVDAIPPSQVRRRIDMAVSRFTRERLLVFVGDGEQLWLWPEQRASGGGFRLVEHRYHPAALNEGLLQRLAEASFSIDEEGRLTVMDVLERVRRSFSADEVTRKFYKEFKKHHDDLLEEIAGIGDETQKSWYGSVLLNRLMFIYFMQKKGFLDDDRDYLRNRLRMVRDHLGPDSFYGFFRQFLLPLFHDGLGSHLHDYTDSEIARIIGDVPYVNGGIFSPHLLEQTYEIDVPDEAFEAIFEFFDRYRWHLDERPSDDPNEINPDVLGYIFEQYVNQKEQGAYYTKEDVTGYMATSTVVPALIDRLGNPEDLWILPTIDPDRYIWESMSYGVDMALPEDVSGGVEDPSRRETWSNKAPASHGLPGETWWEVIDRHQRHWELRKRLEAGSVSDPDAAVTSNIDLLTLLEDHFRMLNSTAEIEKAWETVSGLTILDPTCGSGAFLFAALEILADLYDSLIERAIELATPLDSASFLRSIGDHPNRAYFVMKNTLLNNLYGVDIMYEAGEIARLRLFLKLAAQLKERSELEPLPDLDFNIRAGNLLVGVAHMDDAKRRLSRDLVGISLLDHIVSAGDEVADAYDEFVRSQRESDDPSVTAELKAGLTAKLDARREDVDEFLFGARGESGAIATWRESHQPFHWFIEFPGVFRAGGFDVVVGNPPYISSKKVAAYRWQGFDTDNAPDIYAVCVERAATLLDSDGRFAMIVPLSLSFSGRFEPLRSHLESVFPRRWVSYYGKRPAALFAGVQIRNSILIGARAEGLDQHLSTFVRHWEARYRPHLMKNTAYAALPGSLLQGDQWPMLGNAGCSKLVQLLRERHAPLSAATSSSGWPIYYKQVATYWVPVSHVPPPAFDPVGKEIEQTMMGSISFKAEHERDLGLVALAGKLGYLWWAALGDDFHVTKGVLEAFPFSHGHLGADDQRLVLRQANLLKERVESKEILMFNLNAKRWIGTYDMSDCTDITDVSDLVILADSGGAELWKDLQVWYWSAMKATGEATGSVKGRLPDFI